VATKTAVITAPGWWADPLLRHELRYHNGTAWTNHVLDKGVPDLDPLPVGIKLAAPHPERQPFEPPGFSGVPADQMRKRRRRRAQLRSSMWMVGALMVLLALVVVWFEVVDEKVDFGDAPVPTTPAVPTTPTVPTVPGAATSAPPTAPAATTAPPPTAPPGTAVVVVTAAP
jgi:Protein of unknown function (DUF2510)